MHDHNEVGNISMKRLPLFGRCFSTAIPIVLAAVKGFPPWEPLADLATSRTIAPRVSDICPVFASNDSHILGENSRRTAVLYAQRWLW
jgi:hypothetical protein